MKQLERLLSILLVLLMTVSVTSCVSDDEPGSQSGHDYFYAFVESDPSYYWVVDMNYNKAGAGFDGTFVIRAWTLNGKRMSGMNEYSGKYSIGDGNNRINVTWDHQSMNTLWELTSYGLSMSSPSNPSELQYLKFHRGAPDFE